MNKKILSILLGLFLFVSFNVAQDDTAKTFNEPLAYISYLEGAGAKILSQDSLEEAEINMLIFQGDELRSKHSRIEIYLTNRGYIRLDQNTILDFTILNEDSIMLHIWRGNVYVRVKHEAAVQTPHKQDILTGGSYLIEVKRKTKIYSNPRVPFDDFLSWNFRRNDELNRRTKRYLPEKLSYYESTLYRYGTWRYYAPYGNIWIPRVGFGWRPYFYGRWVWYPIIGWTWISYEPFGWCVYHYGRWQWSIKFGWYWIPTRIWGPHWVYFYSYGNYWCWAPRWYDNGYYQRHRDHYDYTYGRAWTVVHKDQLSSRNLIRSIISKSELQKVPRINQNQLRTSISASKATTTAIRSKSISRTATNTSRTRIRSYIPRINNKSFKSKIIRSIRSNNIKNKIRSRSIDTRKPISQRTKITKTVKTKKKKK